MEIMSSLLAVLLFTMSCNLDTLLLSVGYALGGVTIRFSQQLLLAAVTTAVTWLSLALGDLAAAIFPPGAAETLGGLVLALIGLWFLLDALRRGVGEDVSAPRRSAGWLGWTSLAAALAVNNAAAGVAAGVSGISPLSAAVCNFAVTLVFLSAGSALGKSGAGRLLGRYALPLSGLLLAALGAWKLLP